MMLPYIIVLMTSMDLPITQDSIASESERIFRTYLQTRSAESFARVVQQYVHLVHGVATRSLGGDRSLADDVTQAVFLLLTQKITSIRDARALPTWLHQTTRYAAANAKKLASRRDHHERIAAIARPEVAMSDTDDPSLLLRLDGAIASLASADRQAIVARFLQGMSIAEVATVMGTSSDAAQKRIQRAIEKLRGLLSSPQGGISAAVVISLLASSQAHCAPVSLITGLTTTSLTATGVTSSVSGIAKGTLSMMTSIKIKIAAISAAVLIAGGVMTTAVIHYALADTFPSQAATAVAPSEYIIHAGDMLTVEVEGLMSEKSISERVVKVGSSGDINMQLLPVPIKVEGLTEKQASAAVKKAYADAKLTDGDVRLSVVRAESVLDSHQIVGMWQATKVFLKGKLADEKTTADFRVLITPDQLICYVAGKPDDQSGYVINDTTTPMQIDLTTARGNKTSVGIIQIDGNLLKIMTSQNQERPKSFDEDPEKTGATLVIMKPMATAPTTGPTNAPAH